MEMNNYIINILTSLIIDRVNNENQLTPLYFKLLAKEIIIISLKVYTKN